MRVNPNNEDGFFEMRQRGRTDLLWLANEILGYKDINYEEHHEILEALQSFPGGNELFDQKTGKWAGYRPKCDVWDLRGPRNSLIIYPRGTYKTSLCSISHTIQWIINYPDIRGLLSMATGGQVVKTMSAILGHFRFNDRFRYLYPEFCPTARKAKDWGSNEGFTVPCRKAILREPTLYTCSIGKVMPGDHYEFEKHGDVVNDENCKTPNQVEATKDHFGLCNFLLHRGGTPQRYGWQDIEGTFYDFSDFYMETIDTKSNDPNWKIVVKPPYRADGSLAFPKSLTQEAMDSIRSQPGMTPHIYSCQILLKPVAEGSGLATKEEIRFVPGKVVDALRPQLRLHTTIDLAGMEATSLTSDFTVLTTAGFDRDGRMWIVDMRVGRFTPFEVIEHIFDIHRRFRPIDMKIEKEAHARVLGPFIERERVKRQSFPNLVPIRRDNRTAKKQRIKNLQPWFKMGIIRFPDDLQCKIELIHEITRFSDTSTYHDDILDTLADQMQNQEGEIVGDVVPDAPKSEPPGYQPVPKFLGFGPRGEPMWTGQHENYAYDSHTGL